MNTKERMQLEADVRVEKRPNRATIITIDGKHYSTHTLAIRLGVAVTSVRRSVSKPEPEMWIKKRLWAKREGLRPKCVVYTNGIEFCSKDLLDEHILNLNDTRAYTIINRWRDGEIDTDTLLKGAYLEEVDKYKHRGRKSTSKVKGLGPRKETWEIPQAGTWEKENLNPQHFSSGGGTGHGVAVRSDGTHVYRGD